MAKGTSRPKKSSGRPPGRQGRAGVGPGPGYRTSGVGRGTNHNNKCCPMVAAVVSVKRGNLRLARRYARLSLRLIAGRFA